MQALGLPDTARCSYRSLAKARQLAHVLNQILKISIASRLRRFAALTNVAPLLTLPPAGALP